MDKEKEINEMDEKIQLPPIKKGTSGDVVKMLWEFMQLSDMDQKTLENLLSLINEREYEEPSLEHFLESFKELYRDLIQEITELTCLVHNLKYNQGWSLEQIIEAYPKAEVLITAISIQMDILTNPCDKPTH